MFTSILVGVDRSRHARAAVREAVDIARAERARLTLITVYSSQVPWLMTMAPGGLSQRTIEDLVGTTRTAAQETLDAATALVPPGVDLRTLLVDGRPADAILEEARSGGHDLLVVGSKGRGDAASILLGSVSHAILHHSRVPVLVVHDQAGAAGPRPATTEGSQSACGRASGLTSSDPTGNRPRMHRCGTDTEARGHDHGDDSDLPAVPAVARDDGGVPCGGARGRLPHRGRPESGRSGRDRGDPPISRPDAGPVTGSHGLSPGAAASTGPGRVRAARPA